jgi:hypothetical protein
MDIGPMHERVIGLDIHQAKITGCTIIDHADDSVVHDRREFGGFKRERHTLAEWARSHNRQVDCLSVPKSVKRHRKICEQWLT